ncbi:MAG: hypothetical protein K9M44_03440 [Candidatus Pacebacteria bacterium]|nr:hypothetical protein [Candidatus Paceibacterota bacterium]
MEDIISKIKEAELVGRGGAGFPVYKKWELVKSFSGDKYIIANGAEGEPGVRKDEYILKNHSQEVISALELADKYLQAKEIFLYLNHKFKYLERKLKKQIRGNKKIKIIYKPKNAGYIAGEESALLSILENRHLEAGLRPPFPVESGYNSSPTLVNNVETLYNVSLVAKDQYQNDRFYTISGACFNPGVYKLKEDFSIKQVLELTKNLPAFDFFVQVGGDASGEVLNQKQINHEVSGCGAVTIYNLKKHEPIELLKFWVSFYVDNSCGKCTPCREGTYRLQQMLSAKKMNWDHFLEILDNLSYSSFCALGSSLPIPIKSYLKNINPDLSLT